MDDDVILLSLTAELLSGLGCHVTTARDGAEALAVLDHRHALDLLVTGVQMPGIPNVELARRATAIKPTLAERADAGSDPQQALLHRGIRPEDHARPSGAGIVAR